MRTLRGLLLLAVVLLGVLVVLPTSAGGATDYVTTYGNSMEPTFRAGDLAVVGTAGRYDVGDVVAYRDPRLGRVVLHRIVARDGETFVFQGDNNDFRDAAHLTAEHVLGRVVLRVPRGGTVVSWLADPIHAASVAVAASVLSATLVRRRRHRGPEATRGVPMSTSTTTTIRAAKWWLAAIGAAALALGGVALTRPTTQVVEASVEYTQTVSYTYAAPSSSPLYPDGFTTGDPVFTRLSDRVTVDFTHRVDSEAATDVSGGMTIDAVLSSPSGWTRTLPLLPQRPLGRGTTSARVALDLPALQAIAADAATITGTPAGEFRVAVASRIDLAGTVAGEPVADRFEPSLVFALDAAALRLVPATGEHLDHLGQTRTGTVTVAATEATTVSLPFPGPDPSTSFARTAGLVVGATLLVLAAALASVGRRRGDGEVARIGARYGRLLVPVRDAGIARPADVEVATMGDLVRVARHHEQLVLHHTAGAHHTYLVAARGTTYRYVPVVAREAGANCPQASAMRFS